MTDNEIIKALECCTDELYENCNECPYSTDTLSCERLKLLEDSLDLINRLKAEIEHWKEEAHKLAEVCYDLDVWLDKHNIECEIRNTHI